MSKPVHLHHWPTPNGRKITIVLHEMDQPSKLHLVDTGAGAARAGVLLYRVLDRRLSDREPEVRIFGELYQRRAEVATIGGLSAHAGQTLLTEYALATRGTVKDIYLVHGEAVAAGALTEKLRENGIWNVHFPELRSSVEI